MAWTAAFLTVFVTATFSSLVWGQPHPRMIMPYGGGYFPGLFGLMDLPFQPYSPQVDDPRIPHMEELCKQMEAQLRQLQSARQKDSKEQIVKLQNAVNLCGQLYTKPEQVLDELHEAYLATLPTESESTKQERGRWTEMTATYQNKLAEAFVIRH